MSVEVEVAKALEKIEEVLGEIASEKIDPSLYTEILQEFTDKKKEELKALVDSVSDPLGEKTITMETIGKQRAIGGAYVYQEVWKKDGKITRYGDFILRGYCDDNMLNVIANGGGELRIPLPSDVEFDRLIVGIHNFYAIPKLGQRDAGGVKGSLDHCLFCLGITLMGKLERGTPPMHSFLMFMFLAQE